MSTRDPPSNWSSRSRHERGYGTAWDKVRALVMARDLWLCQCDQCQAGALRVTPAQEVDHIVPKASGGTDDLANLRAVNRDCHRRITTEAKGYRHNRGSGIDGAPLDPRHPFHGGAASPGPALGGHNAGVGVPPGGVDENSFLGFSGDRSEEHTSELQSLS